MPRDNRDPANNPFARAENREHAENARKVHEGRKEELASNAEHQRMKMRTNEERHRDAKDLLTKAVKTMHEHKYGEAKARDVEALVNKISHRVARDRGDE